MHYHESQLPCRPSLGLVLPPLPVGEGMALKLKITSLWAISCSTSMVTCSSLRMIHVFHIVWLGVPIFGGAIVGNV